MDLRVLRYLVEIVRHGGFGRAADKVHLSQPALSKAIRTLEAEVGSVLLERGRRGSEVRLTPAGEVVHKYAAQMLNERDQMLGELYALRKLKKGTLKIGLSPLGSAEIFAPIVARFRETYPDIDIRLMERGGAEQEDALRRGEIELGTSLIPSDKDIDWLLIRDDPMMVALPQAHPLAGAGRLSLQLEELANTPLVTFEPSFLLNKTVRDACRASGFEPIEVTEVTQPDFGLALVAAGAGAMLLPKLIAERHLVAGVTTIPLEGSALHWPLALIWRKHTELSFAATAMHTMILEYVSAQLAQ